LNLHLVLLHLRRGLRSGMGLALLLVVGALFASGGPPAEAGLGASDPAQALRGLERSSWWSALALVLLLGTVTAAAGEHQRWRRGEALWSSTRKLGATGLVGSVWAGRTLALCAWLALIAIVVELAVGGSEVAYQPGPRQEPTLSRGETQSESFRWSLAAPNAAGLRLSVELRWSGDYTTADEIVLSVARRGAQPTRTASAPALTQSFELDLPAGEGPLEFELSAQGAAGVLGLEALEVGLLQPRPERLATWRLAVSLGLLGTALLALALGLGSWMSAASAVALLCVAWGVAWLEGLSWPLPGLDLPASLEAVARGRVPAPLTAPVVAATAGVVLLGLSLRLAALHRGGLR
jgi:hypothetical protein